MGLNTTFITGPDGIGAAETSVESANAERATTDWNLANIFVFVGLKEKNQVALAKGGIKGLRVLISRALVVCRKLDWYRERVAVARCSESEEEPFKNDGGRG